MNKYLIVTSKNGNRVAEQLVLATDIEAALAAAKENHVGEPLSFAAHAEQVAGRFDHYPLIGNVCMLNGGKLTVKVYHNGWSAQYDGKDTSLSDIPTTMHSMIRAVVKGLAYDAGYYTMPAGQSSPGLLDRIDRMNEAVYHFDI